MVISLGIGGIAFPSFLKLSANAEGIENYFSDADYTNDDKLLKSDGTLSTKTITQFSNEVKNALSGADCSEITQVIPRQYMESTETNAVYQYNGEEYGFYMVKEDNYFDLLLIDFVYEFNDNSVHNNEYRIRVEPILQQSFLRQSTANGYTWKKYTTGNRYTYYVTNPRFCNVLENENALNHGDVGYNKQNDPGVIIQQMRVNYGNVSYKTEADQLAFFAELTLDKVLDFVLDNVAGIKGKIMNYLLDAGESSWDYFQQGKEVTIATNNESNIFTEQSRTDQLNNPNLYGFSRIAAMGPQSEVILSEDTASYAESIVLLSDTNCKSRLSQYCDFDIVRRSGNWSSMESVANPASTDDFSFHKERTLFDQETAVEENFMEYYVLADGEHKFAFTPEYSGDYRITSGSNNVQIKINGINQNASEIVRRLEAGTKYTVSFVSTQKSHGVGQIQFEPMTLGESVTIGAGKSYVGKFTPTENGLYTITAPAAQIEVYDDSFPMRNLIKDGDGEVTMVASGEEDYYVVVKNTTAQSITPIVAIQLENPPTLGVTGQSFNLQATKPTYLTLQITTAARYHLSFEGEDADVLGVEILSSTGENMELTTGEFDDGELSIASSYDLAVGTYYVELKSDTTNTVTVSVSRYTSAYQWMVNGQIYNNGEGLRRGQTYTLALLNSANEPMNLFLRPDENQNGVTLTKTASGYSFTVSPTAQMFDDAGDNKFKYKICSSDSSIYFEFPAIYNNESLTLTAHKVDENNDKAYIGFDLILGAGQKAQVSFAYTFAGSSQIYRYGDTFDSGAIKQYVQDLANAGNKYELSSFTIDHIYFLNSDGSQIGRVNNASVSAYSGYKNKISINTISNMGFLFEEGSGATNDPFIIENYKQFLNVQGIITNSSEACFKLSNNIVFPAGSELQPIHGAYNGTFDGDGFGISCSGFTTLNKTCSCTNVNGALFETIFIKGQVLNLNISFTYSFEFNANVSGYIGGITAINYGIIDNCRVTLHYAADVSNLYIGGIAGINENTISDCYTTGSLSGGRYLGGIVAYNKGTVSECRSMMNLIYTAIKKDDDKIGGIVGCTEGNIINCIYGGVIFVEVCSWYSTTYAPYIGGVVGYRYNGTCTGNSFIGQIDVDNLNPSVLVSGSTYHNQRKNVNATATAKP